MNLKQFIQEGVKVVEANCGEKGVVLKDRLMFKDNWIPLDDFYDDNLRYQNNSNADFTIRKIFDAPIKNKYFGWNFKVEGNDCLDLIWERKKIKLTDAERVILENISSNFKYIARDEDGEIRVTEHIPEKDNLSGFWYAQHGDIQGLNVFSRLFSFIKWEDKEVYSIEELLK